jgi:asparagine synthase (glutamine-hydrolysing)
VVRQALATPGGTLYSPTITKRVLRAAAGDALAPLVRARQDKARFDQEVIDAVDALGGIQALAGGPLAARGWVDLDAAERAWAGAVARMRTGGYPTGMHESFVPLWQLVAVDTWLTQAGAH